MSYKLPIKETEKKDKKGDTIWSQDDLTKSEVEKGVPNTLTLQRTRCSDGSACNCGCSWNVIQHDVKTSFSSTSLMSSDMKYDPVSPNAWLTFASSHGATTSLPSHKPPSRFKSYNFTFDRPIAGPRERYGDYFETERGLRNGPHGWLTRTVNNRFQQFYDGYMPGDNHGFGFESSYEKSDKDGKKTGKRKKISEYDSIYMGGGSASASNRFYLAINGKIRGQMMRGPQGNQPSWNPISYYENVGQKHMAGLQVTQHYHPGFLGEGKSTVQLGVKQFIKGQPTKPYTIHGFKFDGRWIDYQIHWAKETRDFIVLPIFQYFDMSQLDKNQVVEHRLPTSFHGITGTWSPCDYIEPAQLPQKDGQPWLDNLEKIPTYGRAAGGDHKWIRKPQMIKDGYGKLGLGWGFEKNGAGDSTIRSLKGDVWMWDKPYGNRTIDAMIESFYMGTDGRISIKKVSTYAKEIKEFRKYTPRTSQEKWFPIKLIWTPTANNPINDTDTIRHHVTLWVKF